MLGGLITSRAPPPNRISFCDGEVEQYFSEGAVMLAFAMHLLETVRGLKEVSLHPDGEHGKRFNFVSWLAAQGFILTNATGRTAYGGTYLRADGRSIIVYPKSGLGDVVAQWDGGGIIAECKGGVLNTRHPGQQARLRQGLCETVGLSLAVPRRDGRKQYAVVPETKATAALASRMATRAFQAGVVIALVDAHGVVKEVT